MPGTKTGVLTIPPRKGADYWPADYADRNRAVANEWEQCPVEMDNRLQPALNSGNCHVQDKTSGRWFTDIARLR